MSGGADALDPRLNAARPDLADRRLEGRVEAERFVAGALYRVVASTAPFHAKPDPSATRIATKLLGETLRVFEIEDGWAWAQSELDAYVGYVRASLLASGGFDESVAERCETAMATAPRTPVFREPGVKSEVLTWAPMGARLALDRGAPPQRGFALLGGDKAGGWVFERHLRRETAEPPSDWVASAEALLRAPYLWGGDTVEGVDCSGLVAAARRSAGLSAPRDSDLQERALGAPLERDAPLRRGDLIFWRGHVGVMTDATTLLHATAHAMAVIAEPLDGAAARIAASEHGEPTSFRRVSSGVGVNS